MSIVFQKIRGRRFLIGLTLLCGVLHPPDTLFGQTEQESRMYRIQHRLVSEFEPMVRALLGKRGTVTISPDLRLIIVNDEPDRLLSVDSLVVAFDLPQHQVKVTVQLVAGYMAEDSLPLPEDLEYLQPLIREQNYEFNAYEVLDQGVILLDDGAMTTLSLASNTYAIEFAIAVSMDPDKMLKFRQFSLTMNERSLSGTSQRTLIGTEFSLKHGLVEMLTAAKQGIDARTLMVFLEAMIM